MAARLTANELKVTFADGTVCRAAGDFAAGVQEGALADCRHSTRYRVDATSRRNPVVGALATVLATLRIEAGLAPFATVTLTGAGGGSVTFASPAD